MHRALVARELDDRAIGSEVPAEDAQRAAGLERRRATAAITSPSGSAAPAACSASVRPSTVGASGVQVGEQLLDHRGGAAGAMEVGGDVAAARRQARHDGCRGRDAVEVLERELDARLVRDREQVEHAVRRPAGAGDPDDRVLERRPRDERRRPHVPGDQVEDEPRRPPRPRRPWRGPPPGRSRGRSARARGSRSRRPSCSP